MNFVLLPAAGRSARMGRPKLALPLGAETVVEHTIAAFRQAGLERILLVTDSSLPDLGFLVSKAGGELLLLQHRTADMRATVDLGLDHLLAKYRPSPHDNLLLCPADHPGLEASAVQQLLDARAAQPERSLFVPTHDGKRGHPILLTWAAAQRLRASPSDVPVNVFVRGLGQETVEVPVQCLGVIQDLDTPEQYEQLRRNRTSPSD
jgi:molybdenum cofactor cytidylyltransferase